MNPPTETTTVLPEEHFIEALSRALVARKLEVHTQAGARVRAKNAATAGSGPAGEALNPGLSQTVECSTAEADGRLWWWWLWSGPTRDAPPELEPLCPADEIDLAADRIARVLAERRNDSES